MSDESELRKCAACNDVVECEDARFCPNCAAPLDPPADAAQANATAEPPPDGRARADAPTLVLRTYGRRPFAPDNGLRLPPAAAHRPLKREQELGQMLTALRQRRAVLLRGEPGVGKTGLAAQAVELLHADGLFKDGIIWVEGVCDASVAAVCDAVATHMGNIEIPLLSPPDKLAAVYQLLDGRDLLIVLNFVRSPETAVVFVRNCPDDTALLVISASHDEFESFDDYVNLGRATADDALSFFGRSMLDENAIRKVCSLLDNNPLALLYASGYVKHHAEVWLDELRRQLNVRMEELRAAGGENEHLQARVAFGVTLRILGPASGRLLALLAASFDKSVGVELLSMALGREETHCAFLLGGLARLSLIELEVEGRYTLHPLSRSLLWQEWHSESKGACEGRLLEAALRYVALYGEGGSQSYDKLEAELSNLLGAARHAHGGGLWPEVVRLAVGLVGVLQERNYWGELLEVGRLGVDAAQRIDDARACARLLREIAATLKNQGDYAEARRLLSQCVELGRRLDDPVQRADTLHQLGQLAHGEHDTERAADFYRESLETYRQSGSQKGIAANLYQLGRIAQERPDFKEAERLYEESLQLRKALGKDHEFELAETLNSLALVHEKTGNYTKAEQLYKRALEIYRLSEQHQSHYAACTHNLAGLYFAKGLYRKAEKNYQKALDIRERLLGAKHPDVAQSLNNLAAVHYARGKYTAAAPLWQQALDIYRAALGEQHVYYAAVLGNLAGLYYVAGNYDAAEPLYQQALEIRRKMLGEKHPGVAQILSNVGLLYGATGRQEEAARLMEEAVEINREILGESHPVYAETLSNLGLLYKEQGRFAAAEELLTRALDIKKHSYRENHPEVAQSLYNLAKLYEEMHNYQQAISYMSKAVKVYQTALNDNHPYVAQSLTSLGLLYELLERFDEAAPLYQKAADIYCNTVGEDHPDYITTLNYLATLYATTNKWAEAREVYKEILRVHRQNQREDEQVAQTLYGLGHVAQVLCEYDEAQSYFTQSLEIKTKLVDRPGEAKVLARLGFIKHQQQQYDEATELYLRGLAISESLRKQGNVAQFLQLLGRTRLEQRRLDEAREFFTRSLEIHRRLGVQSQMAENLRFLGKVARLQGSEEEAQRFEGEGWKITEHLNKVEAVRNNISKPLDENRVRSLSSDLGVNYEDLLGRGESVKLQELAVSVYRQI
jgi:tetratricopeptide (TPR) repeat protein